MSAYSLLLCIVESNPQFLQRKLRDYCRLKSKQKGKLLVMIKIIMIGITFVAYSPLGSPGRLEKESDDVNLLEVDTINEIAKAHKATPAQVS